MCPWRLLLQFDNWRGELKHSDKLFGACLANNIRLQVWALCCLPARESRGRMGRSASRPGQGRRRGSFSFFARETILSFAYGCEKAAKAMGLPSIPKLWHINSARQTAISVYNDYNTGIIIFQYNFSKNKKFFILNF